MEKKNPKKREDQSMPEHNENDASALFQQVKEMRDQLARQQQQSVDVSELRAEIYGIVGQVAAMNTVGNVLENGFETLRAQLAPLRDLTTRRTDLPPQSYASLSNLREALARPAWSGAGSLSVREDRVRFIGEVAPPDRAEDTQGQVQQTYVFVAEIDPGVPDARNRGRAQKGGSSS